MQGDKTLSWNLLHLSLVLRANKNKAFICPTSHSHTYDYYDLSSAMAVAHEGHPQLFFLVPK